MISYTCWPKYSAATSSMVTGMPPEKPASEDSMMSMNTMPDAPNSPVWGNRMHCSTPVTSAVNKIPLSSGMLPYFSSMGGPTTNSSSILLRKCSQFAWPSTWPNSRM